MGTLRRYRVDAVRDLRGVTRIAHLSHPRPDGPMPLCGAAPKRMHYPVADVVDVDTLPGDACPACAGRLETMEQE